MNLTRAGQKIGLDISYFLPRASWVGSRFVLTMVMTFAITVAFARLTTQEIFGQYQYVISLVSLVSFFSLPGINTAALMAFIHGDGGAVVRSVRISTRYSLIATAILLGVSMAYFAKDRSSLGYAVGVGALLLPLHYGFNNWYIYYEGNLNYRSSTLRLLIANLVVLIAVVLALSLHAQTAVLIALFLGLNGIINIIFFLEGERRRSKTARADNLLSIPYAIRCTIQKITSTLAENFQVLVLAHTFGFVSLALFQIAQSIINSFGGFMGALASTYTPLLMRYQRLSHGRIVALHLLLGVAFWMGLSVMIRFIFAPLYGYTYRGAIELATQLSLLVVVIPLKTYVTNFFTVKDKNVFLVTVNIVASVVSLGVFLNQRHAGFHIASIYYMYTLFGLTVVPLTLLYAMQGYKLSGSSNVNEPQS